MLKFLADENISPLTVDLVKQLGYDIVELEDVGLIGSSDLEILAFAEKHNRIIITFDLDFGEIFYYSQSINIGILILRIHPQTVELANNLLGEFLEKKIIEQKKLNQALIVLQRNKYRIRTKDYL